MREPAHAIGTVGRGVVRVVSYLPGPIQDAFTQTITGFLVIALLLLAFVIAIPLFIVTAIPYVAVSSLFGSPSGPLAVVLFLIWFVSWIVLLFVIMVRISRSAPQVARLIELAADPDAMVPSPSPAARDAATAAALPATDASSFEERLAAADAHLAPAEPKVD